ncbi:hypothetical protein Tco_1331931 [Tanacetum coccineum]
MAVVDGRWMVGGNSSGGDGILRSRDDNGDNRDSGGSGRVGAEPYSATRALIDGGRGDAGSVGAEGYSSSSSSKG